MSLRNGSDVVMDGITIWKTTTSWDLHLAAGSFFLKFSTFRAGGYTIVTTKTPAMPISSETEKNDTIDTADAVQGGTLNYTDGQGNITSIKVPGGAVTLPTTLTFTKLASVTPPGGMGSANHAFTLEASQGGNPVPSLSFAQPVLVTIQYGDTDVIGMDEGNLWLGYWNGSAWVDAAATCSPASAYVSNTTENWLSVSICHLSQFALLGAQNGGGLYLPLITR